jgi:hypothetical protein
VKPEPPVTNPERSGPLEAEPRRPRARTATLLGATAGLAILAVVGWTAWNQGALVGLRWVEFDAPLTLAAFGFVAGVGAFFAPCAFALFPGYISYYATSRSRAWCARPDRSPSPQPWRGCRESSGPTCGWRPARPG